MNTKILKYITSISLIIALVFPIIYSTTFTSQSSFPKAIFFYFCSQIIAFLYIWYSANKGTIIIPKNYLCLGLFVYILILFVTAIFGENFRQSFWSYYPHMTGIITWIHLFIFYIVISSIYKEINWKHFFRALSISTIILLIFSYLGPDGFNFSSFFNSAGSLLTNNTKSGIYYILVFFISFIGFSLEESKKWRFLYIFILVAIFFSPELFNNAVLMGNVNLHSILQNPIKLLGMARTSTIVLWFGIIVSGALYFIHKKTHGKTKKILVIGGIVFFLTVYGIVFGVLVENKGNISNLYIQNSGGSRLIVWDATINSIKKNPIVGYGIENFDYVYQDNFNVQIINLENGGAWFDRAHNFIFDILSSVGIVGFLAIIILFIIVIQMSLRIYYKNQEFNYLLIPYIFIFHFIQLQTAFETVTSLFLIFILFAYLSSFDENIISMPISKKNSSSIKILVTIFLVISFYFAVYIPLKQNYIFTNLQNAGTFEKRIDIYRKNEKSLKNLSISPDQTIQRYLNEYILALSPQIEAVYKNKQEEQAKEEILLYLDLYEKYYPQYKNKYKFLIYYAHTINFAKMLGVDELKRGEELLNEALEISNAYPQPYWALVINLSNQGRIEEALLYAKQAYNLDPTIIKSEELYETLQVRIKSHNPQQPLLYLSDL